MNKYQTKKHSTKTIIFSLFLIHLITSNYLTAYQSKVDKNNNLLRILDINVWSGLTYKGILKMGEYDSPQFREKRYNALITQIRQLDPDIIGIHEANKLPHYAKKLANTLGYDFFYHIGLGGVRLGKLGLPWNLREGDVILTKKYLQAGGMGRRQLLGGYVGNWASFHFSDASQVIAVKITYNNQPFFIFATHWHTFLSDSPLILSKIKEQYNRNEITKAEFDDITKKIRKNVNQRIGEAKKTLDFIHQMTINHGFILMGDCNAEPNSSEIKTILDHNIVDTFVEINPGSSGFTWDPNTNKNIKTYYQLKYFPEKTGNVYQKLECFSRKIPKRIDYIFLGPSSYLNSQKIIIKSSRVVIKKAINEVQASDHYGILTEIQINP